MAKSQFSNTEKIEKEVQLADSGYGQGQILVNPLHMACMYSAFCNEGNMIKPYLTYKEDAMPDVWIKEAFTKDVAQTGMVFCFYNGQEYGASYYDRQHGRRRKRKRWKRLCCQKR